MESALEKSMKITEDVYAKKAIEFSIDAFMEQEEKKIIIE